MLSTEFDDWAADDPMPAAAAPGRLIAVMGAKGGVGTTTVALNLAATLQGDGTVATVLFDLALPYNHAARYAGLEPKHSLGSLALRGGPVSDSEILEITVAHPSHLLVLTTALRPEQAEAASPALVNQALDVLLGQSSTVVVDLGVNLNEPALACLDRADQVIVVANPDLGTMFDLPNLYDALLELLRIPRERIHLVLNHRTGARLVDATHFRRQLGLTFSVEIGCDGDRPEMAALKGEIRALDRKPGPIGAGARRLASLAAVGAGLAQAVR